MESLNVESPRPKNSALAIWSLVLGILSVVGMCVTGIPAIILGAIGLKKIRDSGGLLIGKGMAIAGIVCGSVISVIFVVAILASASLPAFNSVANRAEVAKEMNNVRQLLLGSRSWAADHDGEFPPSLEALNPDYLDVEFLQYHNQAPYQYVPGLTDTSSPESVMIYSDEYPTNPPKRVVGFVGGQVKQLSPEEFDAVMGQ